MTYSSVLHIEAGIADRDERIHFLKLLGSTEKAAPPQASEIEEMLRHVSLDRQYQVYGLAFRYSYSEETRPSANSLPFNTLVEVALPYCLYLPNGLNLTVTIPNGAVKMLVIFRKFWTERASGSSEVDVFTQDQITYLAPVSFESPNFPQPASSGPDPACTGTNIERDRETTGYFRYSRLRIFFDTQHAELGSVPPEDFELAQREAVEIALSVVNRILDTYRLVTKEDHVQRLGSIYVTDLYFAEHNIGVHGADFGHGMRGAVMNRPECEIDQIATLLATGDDLPVPELLFLDAEASLRANRLVLTVVHAFQALELFLGTSWKNAWLRKGSMQLLSKKSSASTGAPKRG